VFGRKRERERGGEKEGERKRGRERGGEGGGGAPRFNSEGTFMRRSGHMMNMTVVLRRR
jgi:hypothetical protein